MCKTPSCKKINLAICFVLFSFVMSYAQTQTQERLPKVPLIVQTAAKLEGFRPIHCAVTDKTGKSIRLFTDASEENIYLPIIEGCAVMFRRIDETVDF